MSLSRPRALALLSKCAGNEIWSVSTCRAQGVPNAWIEEMVDSFESGFNVDHETIYVGDAVVNQYRGVRDVDLALRLGQLLGVDVDRVAMTAISPSELVRGIVEAVMDD